MFLLGRIPNNLCKYSALQGMEHSTPLPECRLCTVTSLQIALYNQTGRGKGDRHDLGQATRVNASSGKSQEYQAPFIQSAEKGTPPLWSHSQRPVTSV